MKFSMLVIRQRGAMGSGGGGLHPAAEAGAAEDYGLAGFVDDVGALDS
jgi:hypothetical protein